MSHAGERDLYDRVPPGFGDLPVPVVGVEQMRRAEDRVAGFGLPGPALMEIAGRAVADAVSRRLGGPRQVLVLVGPGNNGGDGLVAARHLTDQGHRVAVYLWVRDEAPDAKMDLLRQRSLPIYRRADDPSGTTCAALLSSSDVVIDALLGTGRSRPIAGDLAAILDQVAGAGPRPALVVGLDVPTGLDCDTGAVDPRTPRCDLTTTLGFPKRGLLLEPGIERAGEIEVLDIGLPRITAADADEEMLTSRSVAASLPARPIAGHKGTFGRVLVIAGARQYTGAPVLTALAAVRGGAGLVTLASVASLVERLAGRALEPTFLPLPETAEGTLDETALDDLLRVIERYQSIVIGPGLGAAAGTARLVQRLLGHLAGPGGPPIVVDADALNVLAATTDFPRLLSDRAILTPHPLEMARLRGRQRPESDRMVVARDAAASWRVTVVLKGAATVIATAGRPTAVSPVATSALATAGTGDVLAGLIGGLLAQGLAVPEAARTGVYLHGLAGQICGQANGEAGTMASDILTQLPRARQIVERSRGTTPFYRAEPRGTIR